MFLKQSKILLALGCSETIAHYTTELARVSERQVSADSSAHRTNDENRWQGLTDRVRPLAGMEAARLVAAAAYVAAADDVVDLREAKLLRSLHEALGLAHAPVGASL